MAGTSDKARFYLEQTVPELREWERRDVFTKNEISSISSQRSSFEHLVNSREATPQIYAKYLTYEHNLSTLARKRILRKGLKNASKSHTKNGQRRIFGLLERGTKKFYGDLALWTQYLDTCRKEGAYKRHERVLTEVLRLFPKKAEVWKYATAQAEGQGDIRTARSYLMRGTRFCKRSWDLYLEWARVEMRWLSKIYGRRQMLGLYAGTPPEQTDDRKTQEQSELREEEKDAEVIALPIVTTGEVEGVDNAESERAGHALNKLDSTPAMSGAIPAAIFDSALKKSNDDIVIAERFFGLFAEFYQLPCTSNILGHVLDRMLEIAPLSPLVLNCNCRRPVIGHAIDSPDYPAALRESFDHIRKGLFETSSKSEFAQRLLSWLEPLAQDEKLVPELKTALSLTLKRTAEQASVDFQGD